MTAPRTYQCPVFSLSAKCIPLEAAQAMPDYFEFSEWLGADFTGWTVRLNTQHIIPTVAAMRGVQS